MSPIEAAELEQQHAERQAAQSQQRAAQDADREAQRSAAHAAKQQHQAEQTALEGQFRAQGMTPWTGADGNLYADPLHAQKQAAAEAKAQAKAAEEAAKASAKQQRAAAIRSGRRHQVNPVDGSPIYLESEEQVAARQQEEAAKLRKAHLDDQIRAAEAEHGAAEAQNQLAGIKPLTEGGRKALEGDPLNPKKPGALGIAKAAALNALREHYGTLATKKVGEGDWNPFNNGPAPEAAEAQKHLDRLNAPDATLTDEDLATLDANVSTKPHAATIANINGLLTKDQELQKARAEHAARVADLKLRRDSPEQWAAAMQARRAALPPEQLQQELQSSAADITTRHQALQQQAATLNGQIAKHTQELDALSAQAAQRRSQGIPAGEIVSYQNPDGTPEHWPRDLASQREAIQARLADTQAQQAPAWQQIQIQQQELQHEAALHDQSAATLASQQTKNQEQRTNNALNSLQFIPGHEQSAADLKRLDAEYNQRLQKLTQTSAASGESAYGYPVKTAEELGLNDYLKEHPEVAGMAWGGGENDSTPEEERVLVVNPHNQYMSDPVRRGGLLKIEAARHRMAEIGYKPDFEISPEQQEWRKKLGAYATNDLAFKQSIISRLLSHDEVPGVTPEQEAAAREFEDTHFKTDDAHPAAVKALQDDIQQRSHAALAMGDARRVAAESTYAGIKAQLAKDPNNGQYWVNGRKNLAEALGISEDEAMHLLEDIESTRDWDSVMGRHNEDVPESQWKSIKNAFADDSDPRQTRVLHNGGLVVNPAITGEKEYRAAVDAADASPEAKAAAMARMPDLRAQYGKEALETLQQLGAHDGLSLATHAYNIAGIAKGDLSALINPDDHTGYDTAQGWEKFRKTQPKDVPIEEQAARYADSLKADQGIFATIMRKSRMIGHSLSQGLHDNVAQVLGVGAGLIPDNFAPGILPKGYASEALMHGAQAVSQHAQLLQADKALHGATGSNFIERGLGEQLPRLSASLIPAAAGAKGLQMGVKALAATSVGARLFPALAASIAEASTPAQAVKAVQTLTRAGLGGAATAGAAQTYGAQLEEIYSTLRKENPELTHEQALSAAQQPALLSAGVTALLTTLGGAHGVEKLLANPGAAKELFKKQFNSQLARMGYIGSQFAKGALKENAEELPDELFSQYQAAVASHPNDPAAGRKAFAQFLKQLPELSLAVSVLGGGGESISAVQESSIQQQASSSAQLPETQAAAWSAIQNHRHLDEATGTEIPDLTQATQTRAALALATAQGGDVADATESQLNAAGWTRRDSKGLDMAPGKYARLKDYTGPNVLNIDQDGRAHIDPAYHASLQQHLPAVAAAIPASATLPVSNRGIPAPSDSTSPPGNPPAGQTPENRPVPDANPAAVQNPAQSGTEPPPVGNPPPPSGPPVTTKNEEPTTKNQEQRTNNSSSTSTTVPTVEKSIADWLVDRHMPDKEAAAAARAIVAHPDMQEKDFDHFARQITARDAVLKSLNITGSTTKSQSASNPLRFQGAGLAKSVPVQSSASETPPTKNQERGTNNSPSLPPSVQAALDDAIPGTPSQEVFAAVKKAVQDKELPEKQAASIVAQQSGAQDHTELRQALENKLGWNPTRANTAAALHFEDRAASPIPLAAAVRDTGSLPVQSPASASGSDNLKPETLNSPTSLSAHAQYATSRLAHLASITDPAKKTWTRKFLALFEKSFEKHHLLYDAIAVGPVARKHLGGQFTAVMVIDGKVTRLIDLDAMASQFAHIESPAAALAATGIEEDVHAMVLQLSRENPSKYGYPALLKQWRALPKALQQSVYQSYHASQASGSSSDNFKPETLNSLTATQQWHMMNEFLRMLVQDAHFGSQITEAVDTAPTLVQWVKDLLKDLGNVLRNLLKTAPPALQSELNSMVAEIGQRLKQIEGRSASTTASIASIPTLADTQAVTHQALTTLLATSQTGILSPHALARIWDQLPPDLQSRAFAAFKGKKQKIPGTWYKARTDGTIAAPKDALMRQLLTTLLTDPTAAAELLTTPAKPLSILDRLLTALGLSTKNQEQGTKNQEQGTTNQEQGTTNQEQGTTNQEPGTNNVPVPLAILHSQILRLLGTLAAAKFVQSLPTAVTTAPAPIAAKIVTARSASSDTAPIAPPPPTKNQEPTTNNSPTSSDPASSILHPSSLPEGRAADMLAAIERAEAQLAQDHTDAANDEGQAKLRAKLRLQEVAATRARFFLLDNATRELHAAEQSGRQDVEKASAMLALALGRIGQRRSASAWRTLGIAERRQLALLGIGVDQHPHTESGGYPYTLSRIEAAELRREFSLEGTPERQIADDELDWTRQQPAEYQTGLDDLAPAYIEKNRDIPILKQQSLDDLALAYPHTTALIRPEWETRQSYGLRTDARSAAGRSATVPVAPSQEPAAPTQQPDLPTAAANPAQVRSSGFNPSDSGSDVATPGRTSASGNFKPETLNSPTSRPPKPPTFDVPVKGFGTIVATFPDTASRDAFQFKHDLARSRRLPSGSERTKLEASLSALKARFMADLGLGDDSVTTKLATYHDHIVSTAADHAAKNRIGGITAPQFEAFSGGHAAPSSKSLPAPAGGDLIADLSRYGIGRLSSQGSAGTPARSSGSGSGSGTPSPISNLPSAAPSDLDWFRTVTDGTAGPHKQAALILAVKAADAGELSTPLARRIWLAGTAGLGLTPAQARWERPGHVLAPNGMAIDAAATILSSQQADGSGTPYQFDSADALGHAILAALDARIAAKAQHADPTLDAEADSQEQSRNFATLISGNQSSGQSMTGAEIAAALDPDTAAENTLKLGTAWFTVDASDDTGLHLTASGPDAHLYGQQTLPLNLSYPVTQINDTPQGEGLAKSPLVSGNSGSSFILHPSSFAPSAPQSPESLEAQRSALPTDQRDIFQRRALETIHRELPPEQLATPQDTAELQRDYQESVDAGESLDESTPDLDLDDDIADSADAYLDGEALGAALRTRHDATFSPAIQTHLGSLERYTWQHKLDDVWDNRAGEYQTKRVSDWDKAITNAETGRDIVHHFDVRKPDGTVQTVSLESALGSLSPEQKKSTTTVIKALRRLPMNEALLQDLQAKRTTYLKAWKQAEQEGWKSAPDIQLQDHSFPARAAEGLKEGTIDGQWVGNYEPNEIPLSAQATRQAKTRWATAKVEPLKLSYEESNKLDSLPRLIKKDRQTLKDAGVTTNSAALPSSQRTPDSSFILYPSSLPSLSTLAESTIQAYLDLPDVAVPSNKQPSAKRSIRAAGAASTTPFPLSSTGGDAGNRDRLDALRDRAQRDWKALVGKDTAALRESFKAKDSFSTILHDFVSRDIPSFDIRGAIIDSAADFAAFNLATRSPYFESLKIALLDSANQVVHSQIVHGGGLNEAIADPKVIAGIIASAQLQHPNTQFFGWMIAHNHPSGDPLPSEADRRVTRRFRDMGENLGLPMLDHVITNGEKYFSFRESGMIGGENIDESIDNLPKKPTKPELPLLPTPAHPSKGTLADWEVIPSGSTGDLHSPVKVFSYLDALRTADPDYYHVLYLDTKHALRAVERLSTSLTTAQLFQRIVLGAAREGAYSFALGFPAATQTAQGGYVSTPNGFVPASQVSENYDHHPVEHQRRLVRTLRERALSIGLQFADAMTHSSTAYFSFTEHGLMEEPTLPAALRSPTKNQEQETKNQEQGTNNSPTPLLPAAPRRAYESMSFDPPFHTAFGDILSYDWMNQPVGGLSSQRTSDWSRARTNPATGRDIVHHFKVRKPDGIHTVSLETALGQLTEPQRHKLQSLIKSEQRRREEASSGQLTLFASNRGIPAPSGSPSSFILHPSSLQAAVTAAASSTDPNPSPAQKEAGNYQKGKVTLHGLRLSIENPRGSIRSGTDASGKPWSVTMPHHYGYFLGTEGKDGDHVDFFLGPNPDSQHVLIINQRKTTKNQEPRTNNNAFDEHKVMLGFTSPAEAARAYLSAYTPGWKGLQSAIPTTVPVLKEWLQNHDTTQPVTRESLAKIAQSLPANPTQVRSSGFSPSGSDSGSGPVSSFILHPSSLAASPRVETAAKLLDRTVTTLGSAANLIPKALGKTLAGVLSTGSHIPGNQSLARASTALGQLDAAAAAKVGTTVANALQRVSGKDIRKAPDAVAAWLGKPDGLGSWIKSVAVDQLLPTALMPREWLALSHEMQRKTAFGAEKSNDLIRALSGNPRLSDLAYPEEFAKNPAYREQLFDAMENKIPWSSLPPAMQALGTKLRQMLRETGLELVKQGIMHPDTFEELQANGWMPRYMLEEAQESAGSVLAAFKLGVKDLLQQRSTAFHIVDTTRKGKDGQPVTVNRQEGGRNAWRFRDAASRDAFYSDFIRRQALDMLQDTHGNTKEVQTMMAALDSQQRREVRAQIKTLTRADMDTPQKLSPALAGMVKAAIEHQKAIYKKENPFDPPKLIKDPVYSIARYILAQTHNAATMELLAETAKNKDWTSNVSLQGFTQIPDATRFGPLAGKFVQSDIAQQILDKMDVPNAALRFYDAVLRKWKSGKLVWNPGSHIRDAVGNTVFAYLGGSNIMNPGNWPYYRQAMEIMRTGSDVGTPARTSGPATTYSELLEHGVLGGDAYSSLVRERLKGLLPDAKTVENFNPGLLQRLFLDFGSKFNATHEQLAEYRRVPDDFYKIAAYLKAKAMLEQQGTKNEELKTRAAEHVRKWFPYYDRLGGSATTRAAGRFVNPFLSFFRESTRILATAAVERPIALTAALAFPAALSALSAMLLGLDDRDRDEINKDLSGRGKGIIGLSKLHLFSMLLPFRSSQGQVQQFDISAIMPFADLLGQKVVPLEDKENAWQTFWRQTASAGPIGNLGVSWITNRDLFSGRHLTESDMSTVEMLSAYTQHAAGVALPPLAPDLAHLVGIGQGGALTRAGERQTNKTLQTYDPTQTFLRSVLGLNIKNAAPSDYRMAEDFRKKHGFEVSPDFDFGTTVTSRVKRALVQQLVQDKPNLTAIKNLKVRLQALGVPLDTEKDISKIITIVDPARQIGGSKKAGLSAEEARQMFRRELPPEARRNHETALQLYQHLLHRAPGLLRAAR